MKNIPFIYSLLSLFFIITFLSSCQDNNKNLYQYGSTLNQLNCYNNLVAELRNDSIAKVIMQVVRPKKQSGRLDRVRVKPEYRFIEIEEVAHLLSEERLGNCYTELKNNNDLLGFRYPAENLIILEINRMRRRLVRERFSYNQTYEFYRLVYGIGNIDRSGLYFGNEFLSWKEEIEPGFIYEVSQQKRIH